MTISVHVLNAFTLVLNLKICICTNFLTTFHATAMKSFIGTNCPFSALIRKQDLGTIKVNINHSLESKLTSELKDFLL